MPVIPVTTTTISGAYAGWTLDQFCIELARRLYDPTETFWPRAEKRLYVAEALRMWNSLTGFWRGDFTFNGRNGVTWYDLTDTSSLPNTLRPLTLHDTDIWTLVQYHLLEPATGLNPWAGVSAQFTADDLINALMRRRDEVLSATECTLTRRLLPAVAGRIQLPQSVLSVRRMSYLPMSTTGQLPSVMMAEDSWAEQAFNFSYLQSPPGTPFTYMMTTQPPLSFDVDVPPGYGGSYELLTVESGAQLLAAGGGQLLVPDDFAWVLKWGVLSDLFGRESLSQDTLRADHAEKLYRLGIAVLADVPSLMFMRIGNVPVLVDSVRSADLYQTTWQTRSLSTPTDALIAGQNMVALTPAPDTGAYSITATVVTNAPIPASDADYIQAGSDEIDALLDVCVHIAMLKCGGAEFISTLPLLHRFMEAAARYNSKMNEIAEFRSLMMGLAQREAVLNPPKGPDSTVTDAIAEAVS
jgi:hypothetical protein